MGDNVMKLEELSNEELISYRDDVREFMNVENSADTRLFQDVSKELYSRLSRLENLKCCGNCKSYRSHKCYCYHAWEPGKCCKRWKADGRTAEERKTGM